MLLLDRQGLQFCQYKCLKGTIISSNKDDHDTCWTLPSSCPCFSLKNLSLLSLSSKLAKNKNNKQNTAGLILAPIIVFSTVLVEKSIVVQVEHQPPGWFANPMVVGGRITFFWVGYVSSPGVYINNLQHVRVGIYMYIYIIYVVLQHASLLRVTNKIHLSSCQGKHPIPKQVSFIIQTASFLTKPGSSADSKPWIPHQATKHHIWDANPSRQQSRDSTGKKYRYNVHSSQKNNYIIIYVMLTTKYTEYTDHQHRTQHPAACGVKNIAWSSSWSNNKVRQGKEPTKSPSKMS